MTTTAPLIDGPIFNSDPDRVCVAGQDLRSLLATTEVADFLDEAAQRRMAEVIGRAIFDPKKQWW